MKTEGKKVKKLNEKVDMISVALRLKNCDVAKHLIKEILLLNKTINKKTTIKDILKCKD